MRFNSSKELSEFLGVNENTICRWLERGLPHGTPDLKRYDYELEDVLRWLVKYSPRHKRFVEDLRIRLLANSTKRGAKEFP
jgi:predicted site-specific integrase-resolvase